MTVTARKPRLCDSAILHVCDPDGGAEGCMCWLDPACTGEWNGYRMIRLPRWLSMAKKPRTVVAMFHARRTLKQHGLWRGRTPRRRKPA